MKFLDNKKKHLFLIFIVILQNFGFGQQEAKTQTGKTVLLYDNGTWKYKDSAVHHSYKNSSFSKLEIPKTHLTDTIICHTGYSLLYNETHEQANWVAYQLTKEELVKIADRTDKFIPDPKVKTGTADNLDYKGSGYDRGHLAPAGDMSWSTSSMAESFYFSNMSPQKPGFNRGIWKNLEEQVREWAEEYNCLYIVTGPVLTEGLQSIGENKVSIPNYYYKVILDYTEPGIKAIGFLMPNESSKETLEHFAVSIDHIEKITGIDFFPLLPDEQETELEKSTCISCWNWKQYKNK